MRSTLRCLLANNLSIDLSALNLCTALVLEPLQTPHTDIDLEHAASELIDALAV